MRCIPITIMITKILWLSILGLALAKAPNPIDSKSSKFSEEEKQRSSRSIWPFASSATTTESPETYPPLLPDNNEWFVQGETSLPEGIDLNKYPIWKIHKYNGINLHPVNLQPHNYYPPEESIVDARYPSGQNLQANNFPPNSYLSGYQDFLDSRDHAERQSQTIHGTHSTGYPPATYPSEKKENYRTGEELSSSFTPGINRYNIQTQQKHEVYVPPLPLTDIRSTVIPEAPKVTGYRYGPPNVYRETVNAERNHEKKIQPVQRQPIGFGEEKSSIIPPVESSNEKEPDLSLLDQLSALNSFFPGDATENSESSSSNKENDTAQQGFFENLFSRFRGTTEAPAPASSQLNDNDDAQKSGGGFLSSLFGQGTEAAIQEPESGQSVNTEPSRNAFSSLFYQPETERPAVILPMTYYLPKTRGSYVAVKIPVTNTAPGLGQTLGPFDDLPKVPFRQHEIPDISSPTLDSGYPYHPGSLDLRNSGLAGSTINSDYPSSVGFGQSHTYPGSIVGSEFYSTKQQNGYKGSEYQVDQNFPPFSTSSNDAEALLDEPRAEYLHSVNDDQINGSPVISSSQSSSHHREEESVRQLPIGYENSLTSTSADDFTQNRNNNFNTQSVNGEIDYRYQNFDTTNSNLRNRIHFGENVVRVEEKGSIDNRESERVPGFELSGDSIPVSSYGVPDKRDEKLNFENGNEDDNGRIIIGDDHYRDNLGGDVTSQNFDHSNPTLNEDLSLPVQSDTSQSFTLPIYQSSIATQSPTVSQTQRDIDRFLPMKEAIDFHQVFNDEERELDNNRFVENLSSLTSLGASTNSYRNEPFSTASSDVKIITVYPSVISDKVDDDDLNVDSNRDAAFRSTLTPEQLHGLKKADRVVLRKVIKRRNNFFEGNNNWQISDPARQAPIEETNASSIIRSEIDLLPETQNGRKFDQTNITSGYSKVQHPRHKILEQDSDPAIEPVNPELEEAVRK